MGFHSVVWYAIIQQCQAGSISQHRSQARVQTMHSVARAAGKAAAQKRAFTGGRGFLQAYCGNVAQLLRDCFEKEFPTNAVSLFRCEERTKRNTEMLSSRMTDLIFTQRFHQSAILYPLRQTLRRASLLGLWYCVTRYAMMIAREVYASPPPNCDSADEGFFEMHVGWIGGTACGNGGNVNIQHDILDEH